MSISLVPYALSSPLAEFATLPAEQNIWVYFGFTSDGQNSAQTQKSATLTENDQGWATGNFGWPPAPEELRLPNLRVGTKRFRSVLALELKPEKG